MQTCYILILGFIKDSVSIFKFLFLNKMSYPTDDFIFLYIERISSKVGRIGTNANQKVLAQNWGQDTETQDTEIHTGSYKDLLRK